MSLSLDTVIGEKYKGKHLSYLQDQHRQLCKQYKNAISFTEAETHYHAIIRWWHSSGATTDEGLHRLELWLAFWHFQYHQWGGFMQLVSTLFF
jgi:hypothetical protein